MDLLERLLAEGYGVNLVPVRAGVAVLVLYRGQIIARVTRPTAGEAIRAAWAESQMEDAK